MSDDKLDKILNEAYSYPLCPSEELVRKTKASLKKPGFPEYAIASVVILNVIGVFIFICIMLLGLHSTIERVVFFTFATVIQNLVILVICLYREEIKAAFAKLETSIS